MKLKLFYLILLFLFISCEEKYDDLDKFRLSKKYYFFRSTSTVPTDAIEYLYDGYGNVIRENILKYNPVIEIYEYKDYQYNGKLKIKTSVFKKTSDGFILSWYINHFYDSYNRIVKEEYVENDDLISSIVEYEYKDGNLIREYHYETFSEYFTENIYTFDSKNRLIKEEINSSDKLEYKYVSHAYDENDRKISLIYCDKNRKVIKCIKKHYNGNSKLAVKEVHYNGIGEKISEYKYYYNKTGNVIEITLNSTCPVLRRAYSGVLLKEEINYSGIEKGCAENEVIRYEYQKI